MARYERGPVSALRLGVNVSLAQGILQDKWLAMSEPGGSPKVLTGESNGGGGSRIARMRVLSAFSSD
jgi:hypothetical protein